MALKTYNGFNHTQRIKALNWLNREYAAGRRKRPTVCDACGQTHGHLEAHSEDYSEPFGGHIGAHGLCYRCHMMIHCRFKNQTAWDIYRRHIREGRIFQPIGRNFSAFCAQTLTKKGEGVPFEHGRARKRTLLDDIDVADTLLR
jgi:hypothetical protein